MSSNATSSKQLEYITGRVSLDNPASSEHLCVLFERFVSTSRVRGYSLHTWKFNRVVIPAPPPPAKPVGTAAVVNETIIAVFRLTRLVNYPTERTPGKEAATDGHRDA
jgi:hypothetical protein